MFYTLFYKKSHLCLNKCIIISTIIYIIIQYLLFSNIFNFSDKIKKIAYSFYVVLIIDIILFCYSVKNDIDVQQKNFNEENDKYTKSIAKIKETLRYKNNIEYDQFQNDNEFETEVDNKQQNNDNNDNNDNQLTSEINNETNVIAENTDFENNDNTFDHSDKSNRITFISDDNNVNEQDINIASINDDKIKNLTNIIDNIKSNHSSNSIKNTRPTKDNNESITIDHTSNNSQNIHNINNENDMIIEGESITFE